MRTKLILAVIIAAVFVGSFWAKRRLERRSPQLVPEVGRAERIVSMAPSITETLFALGLGNRVVGVTQYCNYPPEAREKPRIGGYLNPNYEAIVALRPDLVITLVGEGSGHSAFEKLKLSTVAVNHKSVDGILESIESIGRACGAGARAASIVSDVRSRLERIERKTARRDRPRVMVAIERTLGTGRLEDVYIAGCDGHIDRIIELAGGKNAYQDGAVRFPVVSREGMLHMNPQVIVDMASGVAGETSRREAIRADWQQLSQVEAVKQGRVHLVDDDYAFVPGPRFILLVEKLARLIHPDVDWEE
ncbi:MAG: ABC transporter substrate-binding protein [Planctomycetota bacterium]|jgi:iron complex transport system substrate-binding protein